MSNTVMPVNEDLEKPSKIAKLETAADGEVDYSSACESLESFGGFTFKRILKENPENRFVAVEGTFGVGSSQAAVIVLEKTHFTEVEVQKILTNNTHLQKLFHNGIQNLLFYCQLTIGDLVYKLFSLQMYMATFYAIPL